MPLTGNTTTSAPNSRTPSRIARLTMSDPRILVAEDDLTSQRMLESVLSKWGYPVVSARDGNEAWRIIREEDPPEILILDWMMPGKEGVEICRLLREAPPKTPHYTILLTSRDDKGDVVTGLEAGADDYIKKPFEREELRARIRAATRILNLQKALAQRVRDLEDALDHIKTLQGILPICSYCKKIRDDQNYWQQLELYISSRSGAEFSHSICPDCFETVVKPELQKY